jgi:signal transduction histidine kinase
MTASLELAGRVVDRHPWQVVAGATVTLVAVYFALPAGGAVQTAYHDGIAIVATAILVVRLVRERLATTEPWIWLLLAVGLYAGVSPLWGTIPALTGRELPFATWIDGVYFVSYLFAGAFLLCLVRLRHRDVPGIRHASLVAALEALILAIAITAVVWPIQRATLSVDAALTTPEQAIALGYLLLPAALLGLALRLTTADLRGSVVHWLVLVWIGGELAGDLTYGLMAASGTFSYGHPIGALWIASYVGLGALALHPRLATLTDGAAEMRLAGWRVWYLAVAVLVPVGVLLVRPSTLATWFAIAAIGLGLGRLRVLVLDLADQQDLHARLRRGIDELEEANRRLEHFASIASHDLRAPLATTHALLETFLTRRESPLESADRELVERALANTAGLLQTLEALVTLARTQHVPLAVGPVNLDELLDEVIASLGEELATVRATVHRGRLPVVEADSDLARVLLQNLLTNAAKYRDPARPLEITVEAVRVADTWEIAVADNGRGIDPDDRERVFELFARSGDGHRIGGAGIGLATCKRIAEQHGGRIRVEPAYPGARFVVTLPDRDGSRAGDVAEDAVTAAPAPGDR